MKNIISTIVLSLGLISGISNAQDITNTLALNGNFIIKDDSADYLTLSQSTGFLSLNRSLVLPNTTSPTIGVIFKGIDRFIHNYGTNNTFLGINSGNFSMTGTDNTALGSQSLNSNTTGSFNTANGYQSLYSNTTGYYNTANGYQSLYSNTTGSFNTTNGHLSLLFNTTGHQNTAFGYQSLRYNVTGQANTALGNNSGSSIMFGSNLTCIGNNAQPTTYDANNQITLGNNQVTSLRCNVTTITSLSDVRDKKNITDLTLGLDFITKLKPRQFNWDKREWYDNNKSDCSKMKEEPTAGFIAQELDEVQTEENAEWLNLVLKDNPEKWEATPGNLFPIVVKAVQELAIKNEELTIKNEQLKIQNENLEERLSNFEEMQTILVKKMEQLESNEQLFKVQIVNSENNNQ